MKNKKLIIILCSVLVVLIAAAAVIFAVTRPETDDGKKDILVTIEYKDGEEKEIEIATDKEYFADVLLEEKLVSKEEYDAGYYTVIDGVRADYNADGAWWCVYEAGEMTSVGMNELPVEDGDEFEIVYTPA
ncbi:MAG: DUF4430 domain-containing protein [Clostridia bacterium]|nr:DUF4430 domain-containing protein [Clostridia bacterium]